MKIDSMSTVTTQSGDHAGPSLQVGDIAFKNRQTDAAIGRFGDSQIFADIMDLNLCTTVAQVNETLSAISARIGFDFFHYRGQFHTGGTRYIEKIVSNYDSTWRERYDKQGYTEVDPTVAHAFTSLCPLIWSDNMYQTESQHRFREDACQHGLCEGITIPVHSRQGDVAMVNLAVSTSDEAARRHVREMMFCGSLLAPQTHETMRRIVKSQNMATIPRLTKRETEVLQWISDGKSTWEISKLVGISEHGVVHHVRNVLTKFDVGSRHQAVAKAVACGLL
jgi:LuxR family transcriptional regulator, quorum-sensing system regulator LasR